MVHGIAPSPSVFFDYATELYSTPTPCMVALGACCSMPRERVPYSIFISKQAAATRDFKKAGKGRCRGLIFPCRERDPG